MSRLTRDGTAEPVSRDQNIRRNRGQGSIHFSYSADHEQDWQPCPVDPYSAIRDVHILQGCVTRAIILKRCIHTLLYARPKYQAQTGTGNIIFVFPSADHEKDRQPYPVDPYTAICDDHILQGCVTRAIILKWGSRPFYRYRSGILLLFFYCTVASEFFHTVTL